MAFVEFLRAERADVLSTASDALQRAHLVHYEAAGVEESRRRLEDLLGLVIDGLSGRTLEPTCQFAERLARERFEAGFDISEVQTAFNVLEEAIWRVVIAQLPADELAEATGLVGTVIGAGKDTLARTWVSLAARRHVSSLDLSALFEGTRN
ncbi:MAG: hypothetical protein ACLQNG_15200 [Acidimicrobiales bacterium]|jgi:hypothetical protein